MNEFKRSYSIIWADLDPNRHMRHTAYNDYAAQVRLEFLATKANVWEMGKAGIGPILFREETRFMREVRMGETITIGVAVKKARRDASKWTMLHSVYKEDGELAAQIEVDGAWIDLKKRKTTVPTEDLIALFHEAPKTEDFEWLPDKKT